MERRKSGVSSVLLALLFMFMGLNIAFCFSGLFTPSANAASTASLSGVVKDDGGKPMRGARITAAAGYRTISRYSDQTGHYRIAGLKPDTYDVSATAWGYELKQSKKELSTDAEMSFSLAPKWDVNTLTTAEWMSSVPESEDFLRLQAACMRCHSFAPIIKDRGMTAQQWTDKIMNMGPRWVTPKMTREKAAEIAPLLEKYFGPNSPLPTREKVEHPALSDAALRSTVWEYSPPTTSMIHSIQPDLQGHVWFSEVDWYSGNLGRLDLATQTIQEYSMPNPDRTVGEPHVGRDGRVWLAQFSFKGGDDARISEVDPKTGKITDYASPDGKSCGGSVKDDSAGNVWCVANGIQLVKFDPRKKTFQYYDIPKPPSIPDIYYKTMWVPAPDLKTPWTKAEARVMSPIMHGIAIDSHDNVWYCLYDFGYLGRMDPKTGENKLYRIPGAGRIKGLAVDENDNVWAGDFLGHTLDKLDPKTGNVEKFQPPTHYASIYSVEPDKHGTLWLTDFNGSQISKFDIATKKFTEYPLPRANVMGRFFGVDPQGRVWYGDTSGKFGAVIPEDSTPANRPTRKISAVINK